ADPTSLEAATTATSAKTPQAINPKNPTTKIANKNECDNWDATTMLGIAAMQNTIPNVHIRSFRNRALHATVTLATCCWLASGTIETITSDVMPRKTLTSQLR